MTELRNAPAIIVLYAIVQHVVWAGLLIVDPSVGDITAISSMRKFVPRPWPITIMILVAVLAMIGCVRQKNMLWSTALMIPQQFVLYISAGGALEAMWLSQFADGVVRPRAFLIADQLPAVLLAVFHTWAIIVHVLPARTK